MKPIEIVERILNTIDIDTSELDIVESDNLSLTILLDVPNMHLPVELKTRLSKSSYSSNLLSTDNNKIALMLRREIVDKYISDVVVIMDYVNLNTYLIKFVVLNRLTADRSGNIVDSLLGDYS